MKLITVKDVAVAADVSSKRVYDLVSEGLLKATKIGKAIVWGAEELEQVSANVKRLLKARAEEALEKKHKAEPPVPPQASSPAAGPAAGIQPGAITRVGAEIVAAVESLEATVNQNETLRQSGSVSLLNAISALTSEVRGLRKDLNDAWSLQVDRPDLRVVPQKDGDRR